MRQTVFLTLILCCGHVAVANDSQPLTHIGFGSCAKQDQPQPIWESIGRATPGLFILLGDNIYGDSEDPSVLDRKWKMLFDNPGFRAVRAAVPVIATWDDHDYGANDAGREYVLKDKSKEIFLKYFDEPEDSPRRQHPGVYTAYEYGPPEQRVQVILLDTRYFRTPLKKHGRRFEPGSGLHGPYTATDDSEATLLGEQQWTWLRDQLNKPAKVRIIGSSIQVIPNEHGWEKWGNFPQDRQRLFELIDETKAGGVIFISGDRHHAEISEMDAGAGYPLIDVTSSSLNSPSKWRNELNPHRVGVIYPGENFGMIVIEWSQSDPVIRCQIRDLENNVVLQHRVALSELQPNNDR